MAVWSLLRALAGVEKLRPLSPLIWPAALKLNTAVHSAFTDFIVQSCKVEVPLTTRSTVEPLYLTCAPANRQRRCREKSRLIVLAFPGLIEEYMIIDFVERICL
jgi:hypothetical protein